MSEKYFTGLFEFAMFMISPTGKKWALKEEEAADYEADLSDAIFDHVEAFLEKAGAEDIVLQVETNENNGGPLIDYCFLLKTSSETSPMWHLSLDGLSIPHKFKPGWRIAVSAGSVLREGE